MNYNRLRTKRLKQVFSRKNLHTQREGRQCYFESLETRRLLAIDWVNQGTNNFESIFGPTDALLATAIVQRAIRDWESVILDFNYDGDDNPLTDNTYQLTVNATNFSGGIRAGTDIPQFVNGLPVSTTILMDDDGGGTGWFFDETPLDDAEFTGIANAFQSSFVDASINGQNSVSDFYRTVLHEIGHALGILLVDGLELNSGNWLIQNQVTSQLYNLATDTSDDLFGALTYVGVDQITPARTMILLDPNTSLLQPFTVINELWQYQIPGGATVTFTEDGGGHLYEGPADPNYSTASVHPNELMNPGRTQPPPGSDPFPTTRQFISDLTAQILEGAYGYTVVLPSTFDTAHVTLDHQTGTLLVQGRTGGLNDTIDIDIEGISNETIVIEVNGTTERVPRDYVTQIVIAGHGGTDTITVDSLLTSLRKDVDFVISTNEDSADAGSLGDGIVDLDSNVPGYQVALRAAIRDTNGGSTPRSIYVPRGNYNLTIAGTGAAEEGDLDITTNVTIIGTGAGATIIDAGGSGGLGDRIFHIANSAVANLQRMTLTGGYAPSGGVGGAIYVQVGTLNMHQVAVVGNQTTDSADGFGGGIYVGGLSGGTITDSVITGNHAAIQNGGIVAAGNSSAPSLTISNTIIGLNTAVSSTGKDIHAASTRTITAGGYNRLTSVGNGYTPAGTDEVSAVDYIVTSVVDHYDGTSDTVRMSIRDAVDLSNGASGDGDIWLPAWNFFLTQTRIEDELDEEMYVSQGDIEVFDTLTVLGVSTLTKVQWAPGLAADKVFELVGDFNNNGIVDSTDWIIWRVYEGDPGFPNMPGDADDDMDVDLDDYDWWVSQFGTALQLIQVS